MAFQICVACRSRENLSFEQILKELKKEIEQVQEETVRLGPRFDPDVHRLLRQLFDLCRGRDHCGSMGQWVGGGVERDASHRKHGRGFRRGALWKRPGPFAFWGKDTPARLPPSRYTGKHGEALRPAEWVEAAKVVAERARDVPAAPRGAEEI